jgi:DHA1 family bicyclomycin/chloramphenicol resistance-like MFS transporter
LTTTPHPGLPARAFVALVASMMAIGALGTDIMLPALPEMAASLHVTVANQQQWIIAAYMAGHGSTQLVFGPLSDRYGRKPVLVIGISLFVITSLLVAASSSFMMLLAARCAQGMSSASTRVLVSSVVRDNYSGRQMARVMSLAFVIFLGVPILAPTIGQLITSFIGPWQMIFILLAAYGAVVVVLVALKLPESLDPANRRAISPASIFGAFRIVLEDRYSLGYTLATTGLFGALLGFINSSQEIFATALHAPARFTLVFALAASGMGLGSLLNARIVERLGSRLVSHTALLCFIAVTAAHLGYALIWPETVVSFAIFQTLTMTCFSLCASNFGAMAMERMGHVAGSAASVQGFISTMLGGALIGLLIGQQFDGTVVPVVAGFLVVGFAALLIVLWTEQGQLFQARNADQAPAEA